MESRYLYRRRFAAIVLSFALLVSILPIAGAINSIGCGRGVDVVRGIFDPCSADEIERYQEIRRTAEAILQIQTQTAIPATTMTAEAGMQQAVKATIEAANRR